MKTRARNEFFSFLFFPVGPADDPGTTVNSSSIGLRVITLGLRGGKVYGAVQTEWQCVEGWDLSVSLSGILTALALVCTQTSYMHVSLFTAPPPTSNSSLSTHLSFSAGTTRTYMTYTNTNARMHTQEPRVKVIIS